MKLFHLLDTFLPFKSWINKKIELRNEEIVEKIQPFIGKRKKMIDIGSGTGHTALSLIGMGHKVTCVDVEDMNVFEETKPLIYDGKSLPFSDNSFDVALLITVLHHTPKPEEVIKEASRVAKSIIIMEDTYNNKLQKLLTFAMDSIGNMQFFGHPHSNKSDKEWRQLFRKLGLRLIKSNKKRFFYFFESTTYLVKR